jgi:hypothetical protein
MGMSAVDVPAKTVIDGRRVLDAANFPGATVVALGQGITAPVG